MEACSSSHFWGLEIARFGHSVKLMPPAYVKPYAKRGKTDAADADANCEAVTRPSMRFVSVKTADQQAVLMLHKTLRVVVADDAAGEPIEAGAASREALGIGLSLPTLGKSMIALATALPRLLCASRDSSPEVGLLFLGSMGSTKAASACVSRTSVGSKLTASMAIDWGS